MADGNITSQLTGVGKTLSEVFVNLSAEYPVLLDALIYGFAAVGVIIAGSAVFDFIKMGKRDGNSSGWATFNWKMLAGSSLVDMAFWAKVWTDSVWDLSDPLDISAYAAGAGGGDNTKVAVYAVVGFLVIVGYVTIGKAYLQMSKLGYLSPEARGDAKMMIAARIVAGSAMIAALHISEAVENSTGFNWLPG